MSLGTTKKKNLS